MTITAPTITLATTGSNPKNTTDAELHTTVNTALASLTTQANTDVGAVETSIAAIQANNWVATARVADSAITTAKIADVSVTTAKIADSGITTAKIAADGVTTAKIADSNVTTAKIADSNVTTAKIADSNVTTAKVADANVTTAKIADSNITTAKLADGSATNAKLASVATATIKGRATAGTGVPEDLSVAQVRTVLSITAAGAALIDDADAPAQRTTLGAAADADIESNIGRPWANLGRYDLRLATDVANVGVTRAALVAGNQVVSAQGPAIRMDGAQILSFPARRMFPDGASAMLRGGILRTAMSGVAADHSIELVASWFNSGGTATSTQVLFTWSSALGNLPVVGDVTPFAVPVGDNLDARQVLPKPSGNQRRVDFYLRTYGTSHQTDILLFRDEESNENMARVANETALTLFPDSPAQNRAGYSQLTTADALIAALRLGARPQPLLRASAPVGSSGAAVAYPMLGGDVLAQSRWVQINAGEVHEIFASLYRQADSGVTASETVELRIRYANLVPGAFATETVVKAWTTGGDGIIGANTTVSASARISIAADATRGIIAATSGARFFCAYLTFGGSQKTNVIRLGSRNISGLITETAGMMTISALTALRGAASGLAELDGAGVVPLAQLPGALVLESELTALRGAASGVATLDAMAKVPLAQIPAGINGTFRGSWVPATNTPALGAATDGDWYAINVAGTSSAPIVATWLVGDNIWRAGGAWVRVAGVPFTQANLNETNIALPSYVQGRIDTDATETIGAGQAHATIHDFAKSISRRQILPGAVLTGQLIAGDYTNNANDTDFGGIEGGRVRFIGAGIAAAQTRLAYADIPRTVFDAVNGVMFTGATFDTNMAADRATIKTSIETKYATRVYCPTSFGFLRMQGSSLREVSGMAIINTLAPSTAIGINLGGEGVTRHATGNKVFFDDAVIFGFGTGIHTQYGGGLNIGRHARIIGCGTGMQFQYASGGVFADDALASYAARGQWIISHCDSGINAKGNNGTLYLPGGVIQCSGGWGMWCVKEPYGNLNNTFLEYNLTHGLWLSGCGPWDLSNGSTEFTRLSHNGGHGLLMQDCYGVTYARLIEATGNDHASLDVNITGTIGLVDVTGHSIARLSADSAPLIQAIGR